jgi:hypothetical protein
MRILVMFTISVLLFNNFFHFLIKEFGKFRIFSFCFKCKLKFAKILEIFAIFFIIIFLIKKCLH